MMTFKEAMALLVKNFPTRSITLVVPYKNDYLICAPEKGIGEEDYSDPYFIVSSRNGGIKHFLPTSDISGFASAIRGKILYKK